MNATNKLLDKYAQSCSATMDKDLAAKLRVTKQAVSNWRKGNSHPDAESVARMCEQTGESVAHWLPLIEAERARTPEARKVWLRLAQMAASFAAIALMLRYGVDKHAVTAFVFAAPYTLCEIMALIRYSAGIETILATLGHSPRDLRDAALLSIASDTLCRESELVAIRVEHLHHNRRRNTWSLHVPFSKTNQDGAAPDYRFVSLETIARVHAWQAAAGIDEGALFRAAGGRPRINGTAGNALLPQEVARIFRRRAGTGEHHQRAFHADWIGQRLVGAWCNGNTDPTGRWLED